MASRDPDDKQAPLEVEVERLPLAGEPGAGERATGKKPGVGKVLGPVLAGCFIDLIDLATPQPILGLALGWPLGTYIARQAGAPRKLALQLGFCAGLYCAVPMTAGMPVGTLIGMVVKVRGAVS